MARKKPHIDYIYKTTCKVTKMYYIGMHSTNNLDDGYLGSGKRLRYSIRKYGNENHIKEILEYLPSREELILREIDIVNKVLLSDKLCMNLKEGGQGGFISEEHHRKMCENASKKTIENWKNPDYRNKTILNLSEKAKKRFNDGIAKIPNWVGKNHKESSKKLIGEKSSVNQTGNKNSQFGTCWITNGIDNKKIYKGDLIPNGWMLGRKIKN